MRSVLQKPCARLDPLPPDRRLRGFLNRVLSRRGTQVHLDQTYERDNKGLIKTIKGPHPVTGVEGTLMTFRYDDLQRLIYANSGVNNYLDGYFAYDDADNMLWNSMLSYGNAACPSSATDPNLVYPAQGVGAASDGDSRHPHAPSSICGVVVTYDDNGNTTSYDVDGPGLKLPRTLVYDGENRPVIVKQGTSSVIFSYGPDGERASKTVLGSSETFHYLNGETELRVTTGVASPELVFSLHPDVRRVGSATDFLIKDHLASNRATARMGDSSPEKHNFGPYGNPVASSTTGLSIDRILDGGAKAYINEHYDPETGLNYHHARYQDPLLGRYLTGDWWDVIIAEVDINRYAYSGNDPVNFSDPNGHQSIGHNGGPPLDDDGVESSGPDDLGDIKAIEIWPTIEIAGNRFPDPYFHIGASIIVTQTSATSHELDRIEKQLRTRINDPLNAKHFNAVRREQAGQVVQRKANGQPFDHVTEVKQAMRGLQNDIAKLKNILSRGNLTADQRQRAQALLSQASKRLDNAEKAVSKKPQQSKSEAERKRESERSGERDR